MNKHTAPDLENKVVIVTGGASGMGAACVRLFALSGARVVVVDRNEDLAQSVSQECRADTPIIGDVASSAFCERAVELVLERHQRLDVLVNAAGVIARAGAIETDDEMWKRVMDVNVNGMFYMCRQALPIMQNQKSGCIINFGSVAGKVVWSQQTAYCTSKGAVHQLTRSLALDFCKDGIRVNAVCPGEIDTPMLRSGRDQPPTEQQMRAIAETVPMQRLGDPEEVAAVVVFLASDAASYMTGSLVDVDAGYTLP